MNSIRCSRFSVCVLLSTFGCGDDLVATDSETSSSTDETGDGDGDGDDNRMLELSFSQTKQFDFHWMSKPGDHHYRLLESIEDGAPFVEIGQDLIGSNTASLPMPLYLRQHASYKLRSCDSNDVCTDSSDAVAVSGNLAEAVGYFKASNAESDDRFGTSMALSGDGNTMAVGAPGENGSGATYLFVRNDDNDWSQQAQLEASNAETLDLFGTVVALSGDGNTLVVSATNESSSATGINGDQTDNSASGAGAVYVFARDARGAWSQQAYVKSNSGLTQYFGSSLALSTDGNTMAIGDPRESSIESGSGEVSVYARDDQGTWSMQFSSKGPNPSYLAEFGFSVALSGSGDTLAVGTQDEVFGAHLFKRNGGNNWSLDELGGITTESPQLGSSVALSKDGTVLAIGARSVDRVYLFVSYEGLWVQRGFVMAPLTPVNPENFGVSVALSFDGGVLAVGADRENVAAAGVDGEYMGVATDSGAAYVFVRDDQDMWAQRAHVKSPHIDWANHFGEVVSLSDDGDTLAVGSPSEGSSKKGIGGGPGDDETLAPNSGAVFLY